MEGNFNAKDRKIAKRGQHVVLASDCSGFQELGEFVPCCLKMLQGCSPFIKSAASLRKCDCVFFCSATLLAQSRTLLL
ncbi:hypothetical protein DB346_03515 [Verrucomicrobia bacterium LW23]|nr:hypothetical protein DB346_03515 [Verrucomicrobia bacterium LW23]